MDLSGRVPRALPWAIMNEAVGLMGERVIRAPGALPMAEGNDAVDTFAGGVVSDRVDSSWPRIRRPTASLIIAQGNALGNGRGMNRRLKACRIRGDRWQAGR